MTHSLKHAMRLISLLLLCAATFANLGIRPAMAANPAIGGLYADPHIAQFNGTYYIYPTTDGIANWGATSFKAFSSTDLNTWTDRGVILNLANVSWCHQNAWAPAIAQRGSTYYFYFSACAQIGVATSSSPTGPFTDALGRALVTTNQFGHQSIDPMVFTDDDGQSYLYFGQGQMEVVRLNTNMTSFNGTPTRITPAGYNEGAFVFKRNGTYYFMWSENDTRSEDYRVAYGTSNSPMGPITKRAVILQKNLSLGIRGTGHNSVIVRNGQYYIVYHRFAIPNGDGTHRETCIDLLNFNADGTIRAVVPTLGGIGGNVIVNDNTTGTGNNQFQYTGSWSYGSQNGAYQNDNHWSSAVNANYQVRFNGRQIRLYGARAPNHGIAAVRIDNGAEVNVDFYAAIRSDNTLLWTSPTLAAGNHTLRVRVTGTRNPSSSGNPITADRVDITP
jgi:beta-xylosidase